MPDPDAAPPGSSGPDPASGPPAPRRRRPDAETILPAAMPIVLSPGVVVQDRYEIVRLLGAGGMGQVWLAQDQRLRVKRALKFLSRAMAADRRAMQLLEREAQTVARLKHPGIVALHSLERLARDDDDSDAVFVVMEYVPGWPQPDGAVFHTLEDWREAAGRLAEDQARGVLAEVLEALAYAHDFRDEVVAGGIVHRDIKPANILLDGQGRPVVADFGIARAISSAMSRQSGGAGGGTLYYMSPEQHLGDGLDGRADIYSVGIMAFELLTGEVPFSEGNIGLQHLQKPVPAIPGASPDMNAWIARATAKKADQRWATATEAARGLDTAARERAEREARERAEKEARDRAAQEARYKAKQEERERAERETQARQRAEQQARDKAQREAEDRARREREALERRESINRWIEEEARSAEKKLRERKEREAQADRVNADRQAEAAAQAAKFAARRRHIRDVELAGAGILLVVAVGIIVISCRSSVSTSAPSRSDATVRATPRPQPTQNSRPAPTELRASSLSSRGTTAGERRVLQLAPGVEMAFRWIPPGSFTMGSPPSEEGREDDEIQQRVTLTRGFWMAETETTQAQWRAVMGTNPSYYEGDTLPVENVTWNDAADFCLKVSASSGLRVLLPTESQWEYASRADTTTPFHFGATVSTDQANYDGDYTYGSGRKGVDRHKTTPVGSFPASAWGLYDMHGNVWEWCGDWYGDYPSQGATDPTGPLTGTSRVNRGGSCLSDPANCRSANRNSSSAVRLSSILGFRVVSLPN